MFSTIINQPDTFFSDEAKADDIAFANNLDANENGDNELYVVAQRGKYFVIEIYQDGEHVFTL